MENTIDATTACILPSGHILPLTCELYWSPTTQLAIVERRSLNTVRSSVACRLTRDSVRRASCTTPRAAPDPTNHCCSYNFAALANTTLAPSGVNALLGSAEVDGACGLPEISLLTKLLHADMHYKHTSLKNVAEVCEAGKEGVQRKPRRGKRGACEGSSFQ